MNNNPDIFILGIDPSFNKKMFIGTFKNGAYFNYRKISQIRETHEYLFKEEIKAIASSFKHMVPKPSVKVFIEDQFYSNHIQNFKMIKNLIIVTTEISEAFYNNQIEVQKVYAATWRKWAGIRTRKIDVKKQSKELAQKIMNQKIFSDNNDGDLSESVMIGYAGTQIINERIQKDFF